MVSNTTKRTWYVAGALFLLTVAFILVKTGRDALYIQERGIFQLPFAYIGVALLSLPFAASTLGLMKALGPRTARLVAPLIIEALLWASFALVTSGGGLINTAFFMMVPLAWGVLFSLSWLLAADLLEGAPGRVLARSYGLIGSASILGGLTGAAAARLLASALEPQGLFLAGAAGLVASAAVMAVAQSIFPPPDGASASRNERDEAQPNLREVVGLFRESYPTLLLSLAAVTALIGVLVEFQFYLAAATSGHGPEENTRFFANFYLALSGGAFLIQVLIAPRLQAKFGLHRSLMVLPFVLLGGAAVLIIGGASMTIRSGLRLTEGGLKASLHRSSWEQAYLPIKRLHRSVAKIVIDGAGPHLGEAAAAMMLWFWLSQVVGDQDLVGRNVSWIAYALIVTTAGAILLTHQLRETLNSASIVEEPSAEVPVPDS